MASRPKRKFITSREREILLQHFYDNTEEHEEQFLGHAFDKDGYSDSQFVQSGDNNEEKNGIADDTEIVMVIYCEYFHLRAGRTPLKTKFQELS